MANRKTFFRIAHFFLVVHVFPWLTQAMCRPSLPGTGNTTYSVRLLVKELYQGMSNMYSYGVKEIGQAAHTITSDKIKMIHKKYETLAIRNGNQVCVSYKKVVVLDKNGQNETNFYTCETKCFPLNVSGIIETRVEEGGKVWFGKFPSLCCLWSSTTWLEISVQKPSYKCLRCEGNRCQGNSTSMTKCGSGEKCFSMKFTIKKGNKTIEYPVKGCTNDDIMYSRGCWEGCKDIAVNYRMCINCCHGDGCNNERNKNSSAIIIPIKPVKVQEILRNNGIYYPLSISVLTFFILVNVSL